MGERIRRIDHSRHSQLPGGCMETLMLALLFRLFPLRDSYPDHDSY